MKRVFPFVFLLALLTLAACQVSLKPTAAPAAPAAAAPNLQVLFQDDFSNPKSGWDTMKEKDATIAYEDGRYHIWLNYPHTTIWANPNLHFGDVRVEVDAVKVGGPDNNQFGVICRYQDADNFYFLIVSSDGYYGIGKNANGKQTLLTNGGDMAFSAAVPKGHAAVHLRADCVGDNLALFVNGQPLATVKDDAFSDGDVGLIVGTFEEPGADLLFDNFAVYKP